MRQKAAIGRDPRFECHLARIVDGSGMRAFQKFPAGQHAWHLVAAGHSRDHLAFWKRPEGWLFTGDLVLGEGSSAVLHPDGRVGEVLASLRRLEALRPSRIFPGHGPTVEAAEAKLREYREHRRERERQVEEAIAAGATTPAEIRERIYGPLPPGLARAAEASVSAHLFHLRSRGLEAPEPGPGFFETGDEESGA